jgi:hypothetical protein
MLNAHDFSEINLLDKRAESALEHLAEVFPDNFFLLDNKTYFTKHELMIVGIPYFEHAEHFRKLLTEHSTNIKRTSILLMHQIMGSGLPIEDDIDPEDPLFGPFKFIFNGHIHHGQQLTDKIINVGSPLARDAGDVGKKKGFWIVDLDDPVETISFVDITTKYPQFIQKTVGEELEEWEKSQFIQWIPQVIQDNVKDAELSSKFSTNLSPAVIMENYCNEVLNEKESKEKLTYGLTLVS